MPSPVRTEVGTIGASANMCHGVCYEFGRDDINSAQIAFGESNYSALYAEIIQDLQMLFGLRHPAVIRGNDKQREID